MAKRKLIISIMGLLALTLSGCINQSTDSSTQSPDKTDAQSSAYEAFVQKIQSENLSEYGIDIVSMLGEHFYQDDGASYLTTATITDIDYTLEKCNFSKKGDPSLNDMIIKIDAAKQGPYHADSAYIHVIFAFSLNEDGQFDTVLDETIIGIGSINCEVMDVTGDGKDEIILIKRTGRQAGVQELINILSWRPEQRNMAVIFNEKLFFYPIHPYSCQNSYQFVPTQSGGYDIILYSMIYYMQDDILESGSTRFVFDGNEYVVNGKHYDYQARGEAIAKDILSSKN